MCELTEKDIRWAWQLFRGYSKRHEQLDIQWAEENGYKLEKHEDGCMSYVKTIGVANG